MAGWDPGQKGTDTVIPPATLVWRTQRALATDDGEKARDVVTTITDAVIQDDLSGDVATRLLRSLTSQFPETAPVALAPLAAHVCEGLDGDTKAYYVDAAEAAIDLAKRHPETADEIAAMLSAVDTYTINERRTQQLLIAVAESNPNFLIRNFDRLVTTAHVELPIDQPRGWALARGAHNAEQSFRAYVERQRLRSDDPETDRSTIQTIGQIGLVTPRLVDSHCSTLRAIASDETNPRRVAALTALGLIAGTISLGTDRYGTPSSTDLDSSFDVLADTVETARPAVVTAALTAIKRLVDTHGQYRDPAVSTVIARLKDTDRDPLLEELVATLELLTRSESCPPEVTPLLIDLATTEQSETTPDVVRILGRVDSPEATPDSPPDETVQERINRVLLRAATADAHPIRRGAIDSIEERLEGRTSPNPALVDALIEATEDPNRYVSDDAYSALATAPRSTAVVDALIRGATQSDHCRSVATAAHVHGAKAVVETLVDQLIEALADAPPEYEPESPSPGFARWSAYLYAVKEVIENAPALVESHVDELVASVTDSDTLHDRRIAGVLETLAEHCPETLAQYGDRIDQYLRTDCRPEEAGHVLDALLQVDTVDEDRLSTCYQQYPADTLAPAAANVAAVSPLLAMRSVAAVAPELLVGGHHERINWWIHDLPALGSSHPAVQAPTLDLCARALVADDDWTRWDGARALADVASTHPECVHRLQSALIDALDDWNSHVPRYAVEALGHVGAPSIRSTIAPFSDHPDPSVRSVAQDALAGLSENPLRSIDDRSGPASQTWSYLFDTVRGAAPDENFDPQTDRERRVVLATLLAGLREQSDGVCLRAAAGIARVVDADMSVMHEYQLAPVACFDADDPLLRALAVYTAGVVAQEADADIAATVAATVQQLLDDDEQLVRQWAVCSLGVLAPTVPEGVGAAVGDLESMLSGSKPATKAYVTVTLRRLATVAPEYITPAVPALAACLDEDLPVSKHAASALTTAEPAALVDDPDVPEVVCRLLADDTEFVTDELAGIVGLIATEDPSTLTPYVESLTEGLRYGRVREALACLADHDAAVLEPYEDDIADATNDRHTRRILAAIRASVYPSLLESALSSGLDTLNAELPAFVTYVTHVTDDEARTAAIDALGPTLDSEPQAFDAAIHALVEALDAPAATERQHAAHGITMLVERSAEIERHEAAVDRLFDSLSVRVSDEDWRVRSQSLVATARLLENVDQEALQPHADTIAEPTLARLGDTEGWPRRHAATVLAALPAAVRRDLRLYDRLEQMCLSGEETPPGVPRALASVAVADEAITDALSTLTEVAETADSTVLRQSAFDGIFRLGAAVFDEQAPATDTVRDALDTPLRETIYAALDDPNPSVRYAATVSLGYFGTDEDLTRLGAMTNELQGHQQTAATEALETLRSRLSADMHREKSEQHE